MKEFIDGLFVSRREKAPEFVRASLSFNVPKFIEYLKSKANAAGYVNVDILQSKKGSLYAQLNDWKPESAEVEEDSSEESEDINVERIPF